jgi:hypothetical protein
MSLSPWRFFLAAIAGWMNKQQQDLMAYVVEESRILREKLGGKRIRLGGNQESRLANAAAKVGRAVAQVGVPAMPPRSCAGPSPVVREWP